MSGDKETASQRIRMKVNEYVYLSVSLERLAKKEIGFYSGSFHIFQLFAAEL